jgi:putative cell wall-binding protein
MKYNTTYTNKSKTERTGPLEPGKLSGNKRSETNLTSYDTKIKEDRRIRKKNKENVKPKQKKHEEEMQGFTKPKQSKQKKQTKGINFKERMELRV